MLLGGRRTQQPTINGSGEGDGLDSGWRRLMAMAQRDGVTGYDDNNDGNGAAGYEVDDDGDDHDYVDGTTTMATVRRATTGYDDYDGNG